MKTKRDLPMYALNGSIDVTRHQLRQCLKGRKTPALTDCRQRSVRIAQTKDGTYWAEWTGDTVFWASRWYKIPKAAGDRIRKLQEFVENI